MASSSDSLQSDDAILSAKVYDNPRYLMLFRRHIGRRVAGKGRAVLEGVGLDVPTIDACFTAHPLNEERAVQEGLTKWCEGKGDQPPTWAVLVEAMDYAQIAQQNVQGLKKELGLSESSRMKERALQVLDEFRDQFIQDMDSNAVVLDFLHHDIISKGDQRTITRTENPIEQNKFLHLYLKEKCTEDAFHLVCDIISGVKGNPKMSALGTTMKRRLATGTTVSPSALGEPHTTTQHTVTATQFSASQFLKKYETEFFEVVNPRLSLLRLVRKGVITEHARSDIITSNTADALEVLYDYLTHYVDVDTLEEYLRVAIAAEGYPKMQSLGRKMMEELEQEGADSVPAKAPPDTLSQKVTDHPDHLILFRMYVSRKAATKGRVVLEMVGLLTETIDACFSSHPLDEEGAVQAGLARWSGGQGRQPPTWEVLISAMEYAMIAQQHIKDLKQTLETGREEVKEEKTGREEVKEESLDVLKFQEQYSEVVRNQASVTLKITKCTTIGPPRKGKTCLKHLLIGQEWDVEAGTASTDVMKAPEWVECYSLEDDGAEELWKLVSKEQQKGELIRAVNESTTSSTQLTTPDSQHPTKPTDKTTASGTESRIIPASAHPPTSKRGTARKSATVQQALKALAVACSSEALQDFLKDKQGKVLGKRRLIHFIDTGGQSIYHDVHPVLITSPSIYLVVFSLDDFQQKNDQARLSYFRSDLIQRPLRSIYTFGRKNPEEKNLLQLQPEAPKIFIVGTHLDRIPQDGQEQFLERIDEMIEEEISSKPYHQFVQYDTEGRSFWAVDNTLAGKEQDEDTKEYISTLRLMVQDRSMEMSVQVPLPWMLLKMVMDGKGVRYCKYSELLKEARSRGYVREGSPDADLDIMLRLFNALGLFYHKVPSRCKKEDSLVFIDPDCLYSATSDFLMAAKEEIEDSQRGSEEGQIQAAATKDETAAGRRDSPELLPRMKRRTASEERQILAATKDEMADSQERSNVEKRPYQIYTPLTEPSMDLAGGKQQMESGLPKTQKPRLIPATRKTLSGGVESMKVIQRISSSFNAFLSDMRTVLSSLERTVMNVGQDDTDIVLRNLKKIQKGVEEKNSLFNTANTLQSKYRILAQEMVWKLMNSVRKVLQSSTLEDKKLDGIMEDFWGQCRMTRRSIEVDDFNHLLPLLTELRITAELKQLDCYLIPAVLPQLHDQITPVAGDIEPLLFTVISQDDLLYYLPSGLFCCLISELVTKLRWTVEPLGRTHVAFTHEDLTGMVHVVEHELYIEFKLESTMQANMDCNSVREQIDKRINNVYDMIYDPPESRREVVASTESKRAVVGFKCNCGRGPAHAPHIAAYEEDKFESCVRCLLQGSTDAHMRPLTQQQLVWFPRPAVAGMQ